MPKHARKHETHPPRVKKKKREFRLDSNDRGFICASVNFAGGYNEMTPLVLFESFVTNLLLGLSTKRKKKKMLVS